MWEVLTPVGERFTDSQSAEDFCSKVNFAFATSSTSDRIPFAGWKHRNRTAHMPFGEKAVNLASGDFDRSRRPSLRSTDRVAHSLARPGGDYRGLGAPPASSSSRRADTGLCSSYDTRRRCRAADRVAGGRPGNLSALAGKRVSSAVSWRAQAAFDPISSDCGTRRILRGVSYTSGGQRP